MKAVLISLTAAVISVLFAVGLVALAVRLSQKAVSKKKRAFFTLLTWLVFFVSGGVADVGAYYHCGDAALQALQSGSGVSVGQIDGGILFDGAGEKSVLIFYPGAKVDEKAYAPLCRQLAIEGLDCILVRMPLRMAFLDKAAADRYIGNYGYEEYYVGGHSLGGAMAASYASENAGKLTGLVLLAAYPTAPLAKLSFCSVTGSEDRVMRWENYESGRAFWPAGAAELTIAGGNHAQFGDYGIQKGDGAAAIPAAEQWRQTVAFIMEKTADR